LPFTPFHFGPGALVHTLAPRHVSFLAFAGANVLIDVEPLYYMLTDQDNLHRFFHTYIGATVATLLTFVLFAGALAAAKRIRLPDIFRWQALRLTPVAIGAALGAYSHIALDSIMHSDIRPLAPFSQANALYLLVSIDDLQYLCVLAAVAAAGVLAARKLAGRRRG
jgi:membrane-bound metal-dependent hydrolase YbcI (DUF457 family)